MKNIFKVFTFLAIGALALTACDKEPELPWGSFDDMEYTDDLYVYNLSWEDDTINSVFPAAVPELWENNLKISAVRGYAKKVDLFVYFNNGTTWFGPYDILWNVPSIPASVPLDAVTLINVIQEYSSVADIAPGHTYAFGLRVTTQDNKTFETIGVVGGVLRNQVSGNIRNYPGAGFVLNLRTVAVCPVEMTDFIGTWNVEEFSDRFSAPDAFSVTIDLDADGETLLVTRLPNWPANPDYPPARIIMDKSNPYAWVPYFDETQVLDYFGVYDLRLLFNSDYENSFSSCDFEMVMGYDIGAYGAGGGPLLGFFDWGLWKFTKPNGKKSVNDEPRIDKYRDIEIVESKN